MRDSRLKTKQVHTSHTGGSVHCTAEGPSSVLSLHGFSFSRNCVHDSWKIKQLYILYLTPVWREDPRSFDSFPDHNLLYFLRIWIQSLLIQQGNCQLHKQFKFILGMGLEILILQVKQTRMIWIRGADPKENNSQSGADPCGKKVRIRLRDKTVQIRPNETDPWHVHTACLKISTFYNMSQGCNQIPVISEFAFWQRRKPVSCVPPPPDSPAKRREIAGPRI